jgi:Tol biopolymer transport system component
VVALRDGVPASEPWQLTEGKAAETFPSWSPDGTRLAFLRGDELWVVEARPGAAPARTPIRGLLSNAVWDSDGTAVVAAGAWDGRTSVYRLRLADGSREQLQPPVALHTEIPNVFLSASRDRLTLAVHVSEARGDVWVARRGDERR